MSTLHPMNRLTATIPSLFISSVDQSLRPEPETRYRSACVSAPWPQFLEETEAYLARPSPTLSSPSAYFNDAQGQATEDAGTIAAFNVFPMNEATAAAAYGFNKNVEISIVK